jgi:transcription-repair coupling factor (superfamily II helicase)
MCVAGMTLPAPGRLAELAGLLQQQEGFAEVVASLHAGHAATLDGVWGSSCALVTAALLRHSPGAVVVVCPHGDEVDDLIDDLALFTRQAAARFPAWESMPGEHDAASGIFGDRLRVLKGLLDVSEMPSLQAGAEDGPARLMPPPFTDSHPSPLPEGEGMPKLIVCSIQSLLQPVPLPETLRRHSRLLRVGAGMRVEELSRWLAENGFVSLPAVELPGEFSVRGGIVDIFAPDWLDPVRVEFFGDAVESLRRFEVSSQRSLGTIESVEVTVLPPPASDHAHLADYLPPQSWFLLVEPLELEQQGRYYLERLDRPAQLHDVTSVLRQVYRFPSITAAAVAGGSLETTCRLKIESVERFSGDINRVRDELDEAGQGQEVFVVCETEAEARRLGEIFSDTGAAREGRLQFPLGTLHNGFRLVRERIVLLSSAELFCRTELRRPTPRRLTRVIDSFLELREGDLVVHVAQGIARYRGLKLLEKNGQVEEHLELEFEGRTKLYVPTAKIGLVQKYVGGARSRPRLARLGGRLWQRQKDRVTESVTDLAAGMLEMQAARLTRPGIAFPPDTQWQQEFDASFPYRETSDQLATLEAIKTDMHHPRPMDRLLCGDVGFGKTEVAMRAAFKAVDAGYQVAVLVPTTVLCEQHRRTFSQRMAEFPFQIAALSRFATRHQQAEILEKLAAGTIDIVIGTHRLAQPDVRFHNLGLVILDEEQRFGVEVKERLKTLRQIVDVLTMTATPIPRTLHMSLMGLRDISNLETPPEDRLAVETRVQRFDPELIRPAVLRELNRGGQVYFVHNRVEDIETLAQRLRQIVPEARLAVAHGQMPEHDLERAMLMFVDQQIDLLLATTIVENGLDIPNANTIFIDEADRYGLADLHQLRGRVGRYKHRAYCHLLLDPNKPLSSSAVKRLRAIEEFSDIGAGFAIAMRDLEIRGAGNILGTEQSGHIAAVGYELYCSLLEQSVEQLKRLPPKEILEVDLDLPGPGYLPRTYVPDMRLKIDLYRRLARVSNLLELSDFRSELIDRFGPLPAAAKHLLALAEIRIFARIWGIDSIHVEEQYVVFTYTSAPKIRLLAADCEGRLRVVDDRSAYLPVEQGVAKQEPLLNLLKSLLRPR